MVSTKSNKSIKMLSSYTMIQLYTNISTTTSALIAYNICIMCITISLSLCTINYYGQVLAIPESPEGGPSYLNLSVAQVVRSRGFKAQVYKTVTEDGYVLSMTRVINPRADPKHIYKTVLVHHGAVGSLISPQLSLGVYSHPKKPTKEFNHGLLNQHHSRGQSHRSYSHFRELSLPNAWKSRGIQGKGDKRFSIPKKQYRRNKKIVRNKRSNSSPVGALTKLEQSSELSDHCLIYYLSNNNYDVWLLESRGSTKESSGHVNTTLENHHTYWDFNLDDLALKDLPTQINFIVHKSGQKKVAYIGYSQSTLLMFALLSEYPEFSSKLVAFVAIAPVVYLNKVKGTSSLGVIFPSFAIPSVPLFSFNISKILNKNMADMCVPPSTSVESCRLSVNSYVGPDENFNIMNKALYSRIFSPSSGKILSHYGQLMHSPNFHKFNYIFPHANMKHYNQTKPPEYNLTRIHFNRIILVRSRGNDFFSLDSQQERIKNELQEPLFKDIVTPDYYNHYGFFLANNSFEYVTMPVFNAIEKAFELEKKTKQKEKHNSGVLTRGLLSEYLLDRGFVVDNAE